MHLQAVLSSVLVVNLINTVHSAEKLEQKYLMTKPAGKLVLIECKFSANCNNYLHWYQMKEGEIKRVQYVDIITGTATNSPFYEYLKSARKGIQTFLLKIPELKPELSATYYCACWTGYHSKETNPPKGAETKWVSLTINSNLFVLECHTVANEKVFGSGTSLYVSDAVVKPTVTAYPISQPNNGKRTLLCQARGMTPDRVRFTWKDKSGQEVKLSDTDDLLEQKDEDQEVRVTSMLIIDEQKATSDTYTCSVQHEIDQTVRIPTGIPDEGKKPDIDPTPGPVPTCPPSTPEQPEQTDGEEEEQEKTHGSFELTRKLYLFSLTYMALLGKNVLYFCAVCVLLYKKRAGGSNSVSSKTPKPVQVKKTRSS